jgi:hypothetical protein
VWRRAKDGTPAKSAWHFVTIDREIAEAIHAAAQGRAAAWGSVYVSVTIGKTQWRASLFSKKMSVEIFCRSRRASARQSNSPKAIG